MTKTLFFLFQIDLSQVSLIYPTLDHLLHYIFISTVQITFYFVFSFVFPMHSHFYTQKMPVSTPSHKILVSDKFWHLVYGMERRYQALTTVDSVLVIEYK